MNMCMVVLALWVWQVAIREEFMLRISMHIVPLPYERGIMSVLMKTLPVLVHMTTSSSQPSPTLQYFSTCTVIIGANQRGSQAGRLASAFWVASHTWKHQGRQTRGTWTSLTCSLQFLNLPLLPKEQLAPFWFNFTFLGSSGSIFPKSSQKFKN